MYSVGKTAHMFLHFHSLHIPQFTAKRRSRKVVNLWNQAQRNNHVIFPTDQSRAFHTFHSRDYPFHIPQFHRLPTPAFCQVLFCSSRLLFKWPDVQWPFVHSVFFEAMLTKKHQTFFIKLAWYSIIDST